MNRAGLSAAVVRGEAAAFSSFTFPLRGPLTWRWTKVAPSTLGLLLAATHLLGQVGAAVPNWTVPPYHGSSGGLTTMVDFTPPRAFVAVTPCRVVDTRNPVGPLGGPALATNVARTFFIGNAPCLQLFPSGIEAYSLNFGGILPPADGFLTAWPTGSSQPVVSQLNFVAGEVVANAAIVPAGPGGAIDVLVNIGPTNIYIDINGYFSDTLGNFAGNSFVVTNFSANFFAAYFTNGAAGGAVSGDGGSRGVQGQARSPANNSAGVYGFDGGGFVPGSFLSAGVRGDSGGPGIGVFGLTTTGGSGVAGYRASSIGDLQAGSELGFTTTIGLQTFGTTAATGMKNFVEPHPSDASKIIRYVSLEGNEAGTYFRGRGKLQSGIAVIEVPEDFRIVTDPEGLSIQVTPIGQMATVAVESISLDRVVVRGSRNVEFFYTVNGIRRAYRDAGPIAENEKQFVPRSADEPMPAYLPAVLQQRLISNGTYTADGRVNMETARRLGWDKIWEERSRPAPQPVEP